ncbi:MAG: DUF296 domain-containing protein [Candidatus Omnitrophota bacterium]
MEVSPGRIFIGRFGFTADLLVMLTQVCNRKHITMGVFSVIGALERVKLGYYSQEKKCYVECVSLDKKLEIASCLGNISLVDSKIFVHAHITLADHKGTCYGGHLLEGSSIFAAEYYIRELCGSQLERKYDSQTGLNLWPI